MEFSVSSFHEPVVYLLAKLSGWKAYGYVAPQDVIENALQLVGFTKEPSEDLIELVNQAVKSQCRRFGEEQNTFCSIVDHDQWGQTVLGLPDTQRWGLTAAGLAQAKRLKDKYEGQITLASGPNLTAQWVEKNYRSLYSRIRSYLGRKMPKSKYFNKIDDHIQTFFTNLINRDGLRSRLEADTQIPPSQVCLWAWRSALSEIRNEGQEPVCRHLHGALPTKEVQDRQERKEPTVRMTTFDSKQVKQFEDEDVFSLVLVDEDSFEESYLHNDSFSRLWHTLSEAIDRDLSEEQNPTWHNQVLRDRYLEGLNVQEIADKYGIERNQATVALSRIRKVMRRNHRSLEKAYL